MNLQNFLVPYIISNVFSLALIFICSRWFKAGKILWGVIFFAAGAFNILTAFTSPHIYVEAYGPSAVLPFYRDFIYGAFSRYTALYVTLIGVGQITTAGLLLLSHRTFRLGILGGILFLLAIAPLGLGSAFPCTLLMAVSLVLLWRKGQSGEKPAF
ncbi:hypothetical protein ACX8XP_05225 [Calditrichota bacterium LG25]